MESNIVYAAEWCGHLPLGGTKTPWRVARRVGGAEAILGYFGVEAAAVTYAKAEAREAAAAEAARAVVVTGRAGDPAKTRWVREYAGA